MATVETRYARLGDEHVAYQVVGDGPVDVVLIANWFGHLEAAWEWPPLAEALRRLASFSRLLLFDKRGVGMSDPLPLRALPGLEEWMDDVLAVMDAAGSERAALVGIGSGGPMALLVAATHAERTAALVLVNAYARLARAEDYPAGVPPHLAEALLGLPWPSDALTGALAGRDGPADRRLAAWWAHYSRLSASPGTASTMRRMLFDIDVRPALPAVSAPTLVLHRRGNPWVRADHGRYLAERISGARLVELDGDEDLFFTGDVDGLLDEVEEFLTGVRRAPDPERVLATVLFTDIVDSTATAQRLGDRRWHALLDRHDELLEREVARWRGRKVQGTGDGMLATFDGPARAVRCAGAIRDGVRGLELEVRAGVHAGEVERRGDDIGGVAVHLASRVASSAGPAEVLVSRTVVDLVAGSGLAFADRGEHDLKGFADPVRLFAAV